MSAELREEFNKVKAESLSVINKAKAESRDLTAEEREQNDRRFARLDEIKSILKAEEKANSYELEQFATAAVKEMAQGNHSPLAQNFDKQAEAVELSENAFAAYFDKELDRKSYQKYKKEINAYLKGSQEKYTLISTSGSSAFLPTKVLTPAVVRRLNNGILAGIISAGYQPIYTADTATYDLPIFDDTANDAANTSESASSETDADAGVSNVALGATLFDSKAAWFSNTMLLAPGFDILAYVEPMLEKRVDHKMQAVWTSSLNSAATLNYTFAHATSATYADFLGAFHKVPPQYRSDLVWNFSDTAVQLLRGLVDNYGRPIYVESLSSEMPDTLFGKPLFVNDSYSAVGANAVVGFAASGECLKARICTNRRLAKYMNIPGHPDAQGLELFVNAGFGINTAGVATITMGAS